MQGETSSWTDSTRYLDSNVWFPKALSTVYPNVTEACKMIGAKDAKEFQERVLFEAGVAILPSTSFGKRDEGESSGVRQVLIMQLPERTL